MHTSNEVAIRVLHKQRGTDSVWSLDTLQEKVLAMREMYQRTEDGLALLMVSGGAGQGRPAGGGAARGEWGGWGRADRPGRGCSW